MADRLASLADAYLSHLAVERRLARNSLESYARDLVALQAYVANHALEPGRLTREDLEAFVRELMGEGRSPRSVDRVVACVRGFFRFLVLDGVLAQSPAADLRPPRGVATLPRHLSSDEVERLLAQPDVSTPRGLRDRAFLELLYATGLRVSELVALRLPDLNLEAACVTCTGKGGKQRIVPIGDEACRWLRDYLLRARPGLLGKRASPRVFVNARGGGHSLSRVAICERANRRSAHPLLLSTS